MDHPLGLHPTKIIAVHVNYRSRADQRGLLPDVPSYFLKPPSTLAADGAELVRPQGCELMVVEGEIAVIIGERAHRVDPDRALDVVAGYAPANDVGVLDFRGADRGANLRSKGQDGFTPVGSRLRNAAGVDPAELVLRTYVNGELRQDSTGDRMIFPIAQLVADLSRLMTLEPGDIILTGTPAGAGVVEPGDLVEVELVGFGRVGNRVVEAAEPLAPFGAMPVATPEARALAYGRPPSPGTPPATSPPATSPPATTPPGKAPPRNAPLSPPTRELLGRVATATLSAQLHKHGVAEHVIDGIRPSRPGLRLLGFARTLRYLPLREDMFDRVGGGHNAQKRAVDSLEPGEVLVIDARQEHGAGTIGDILVLAAMARGAAGVVTDGGVRDSAAVAALNLPVYAGGSHPAVLGRRHVPMDLDLPVACGGCLVLPGDVLVGDDDGVVVIPRPMVDEIAVAAAAQEREEAFIADRVRAGQSLSGLYPMDGRRRAEYEEAADEVS